MAAAGIEMVRYADDFVILCRSQREAEQALEQVRQWTEQAGLTLHPVKTRIVDATQPGGFDFLGYHFERGRKWPREKSLQKFRDTIRAKTRRTNGQSLKVIIEDVNRTLKGWFEYFKHSYPDDLSHRRRLGARTTSEYPAQTAVADKAAARGSDHQRWPNAFFAEQGLFSLTAAHAMACQSLRR